MTTAEEVVVIYAGVRGYLDKIAQKEIARFEKLWLEYVKATKPEILELIVKEKELTKDTDAKIKAAIEDFIAANDFASR
jgi:F0F1-type ATP synthase alpha subunit